VLLKRKQKNKFMANDNETIIKLMKHSIAIQLYVNNATMDDICKSLKLSKPTVVEMLKGIKKAK